MCFVTCLSLIRRSLLRSCSPPRQRLAIPSCQAREVPAALEPLAPEDPPEIGGYQLRARLGSGGMGRVYLGFSTAGRAVAVKVIHPALAQDPEFRTRFRQEAAAAQAVSGSLHRAGSSRRTRRRSPWLATGFVPGPSPAEAVADGGPLPAASAWRLAAGLAEALEAVYARGLVGRGALPRRPRRARPGRHPDAAA